MTILAALLAFAASAQPAPTPAPTAADAQAALGAVAAYEARGRGRGACAAPRTDGATFAVIRNGNAENGSELPMLIPAPDWRSPRRGGESPAAALPAATRRALTAAVRDLVTGPLLPDLAPGIDPAVPRRPLRPCAGDPAAAGRSIAFSSPSFGGGFAFVADRFACESPCAGGRLYALARRGAAWEIVALVHDWAD